MFATAILSQVLLAATALAVPSSYERYSRRIERRALGVHLSKPSLRHDPQPSSVHESQGPTDNADVKYSANWAGESFPLPAPYMVLMAAQAPFSSRIMYVFPFWHMA